jgi:hypothetical protein
MENCSGKFYVKITLLYIICDKFKISPASRYTSGEEKITKIITFLKRPHYAPIFIVSFPGGDDFNVTLTGRFKRYYNYALV